MRIQPYQNNTNFYAINQKYLKCAERDLKKGIGVSGELYRKLRYEVDWGDIPVQDGIDTINAVKELMGGKTDSFIEHVLDGFYQELKLRK